MWNISFSQSKKNQNVIFLLDANIFSKSDMSKKLYLKIYRVLFFSHPKSEALLNHQIKIWRVVEYSIRNLTRV